LVFHEESFFVKALDISPILFLHKDLIVLILCQRLYVEIEANLEKEVIMNFSDLVIAGLTGGLASAFVTGVYGRFAENRKRKANIVEKQLRLLYGPLHYLAIQNEKLELLNEKARLAFGEVSRRKIDSTDPQVHEKLTDEIEKMWDVSYRYSLEIIKNNRAIIKTLKMNWYLIDPEDEKTFGEFHLDLLRMDVEYDENQKLRLPGEVWGKLGAYRIIIPEFMELIKRRFSEKQKEQKSLMALTFDEDQ
jgi:hypothetical protein